MANHTLLKELQQKIDYQFKDENLLFTAVTHSSYANEHKLHKIHHNERLEFLGDAVLEIVSSDFLFKNFPDMAEGQMSKKRAVRYHAVSGQERYTLEWTKHGALALENI